MKNKRTVLVTGADGQLGSELRFLSTTEGELDFVFAGSEELDITDQARVAGFLQQKRPDYCINCAAYTAVDRAESEPVQADRINHLACQYLAEACHTTGTTLIHISTDFVFDGKARSPIAEDHPTHPISQYGLSKRKGEEAILRIHPKAYIVRTSWLYSSYGNNFVKTMLRLAREKEELGIVSDQEGTPTYAADLAAALIKMIRSDQQAYGIYHYSDEGTATWYEFAKAVFEYSGASIKVKPISTEQYPTPARRPAYSVLDKSKIRAAFGLHIPRWEDSLKKCLERMRES